MKYLLLIYADEKPWVQASPAEREEGLAEWWAYGDATRSAGVHVASNALKPTDTATTVRVRGGKTLQTDGPFAETKEQLGGYYLIEVPDLDTAVQWAERCPGARYGSVEVRPVMVYERK